MIDHPWVPDIYCDALRLPKSVVADADSIQMRTLQVRICAKNTCGGVRQWAAETMRIGQENGGLTEQQIDNQVRERIWEIAQSMGIMDKQGAISEQWDIIIDGCVTRIGDLASTGHFWNGTWQTRLTMIVANWRQRWMRSHWLGFTEGGIGWKKPQPRRGNSCTLVWISSPPRFDYSTWWGIHSGEDEEETSGGWCSPIQARTHSSTDCLAQAFTFTIAYVDPVIPGMRVVENTTKVFSLHWPREDESMLLLVTSIIDPTIWQSWMLYSPVCQTPDRQSGIFGAAGRSPMEMVVCMPIMLRQSSVTILLPDGQRW